jgi:Lon protease-like protein
MTLAMDLLPVFPLPNVVLFPGGLLPLHIFEPRYRAMTADALEADRRIGMVLLKPGWDADYNGRPPIFPVGCSGVIVHAARLDDGRYNIVLRGLDRVRIVKEDDARAYRRATTEPWPDPQLAEFDQAALADVRARIAGLLGAAYAPPLSLMPDAEFIHTLAQSLDFEPLEKQALLESPDLARRAESLLQLLEMKRLLENMPAVPDRPQ